VRQAAPVERAGPRFDPGGVADSIAMAFDGHPVLAAINLLLSVDTGDEAPQVAQQPQCGVCEGGDFAVAVVTFCPKCRAVRDESVLYFCTECGFDFVARSVVSEFWVSFAKATADALLAHNVALVRANAASFENSLRASQQKAMLDALRSDEKLIAMCRCGLPGQVGRYVALLLTTQQLIWNRQSAVSELTGSNVPWQEVLAIRAHNPAKTSSERGIQIELRDRPPLVLTDFRGTGIALNGSQVSFTVEGLFGTMHDLWSPHREVNAAPAAPPPAALSVGRHAQLEPTPAPVGEPRPVGWVAAPRSGQVPPPPPIARPPMKAGWYPDPARTARLRWWTGTQWTGHCLP
jgi:hypothetical protein